MKLVMLIKGAYRDYERILVCYFSTTKFMIAMVTGMLQIVSALKRMVQSR